MKNLSTATLPPLCKRRVVSTFAAFGLAIAPIFMTSCSRQSAQHAELERKDNEKELLAKLPNLKSMSDIERYRLFDQLKKVGGEATVRALIPLLEAHRFDDENIYSVRETLKLIGKAHLPLLLEALRSRGYYTPVNALDVICEMEMDQFEKLKILFDLFTWKKGFPFWLDSEIKRMLNGKIEPRVLALANETFSRGNKHGRYALLHAVGEIQDAGVVQLLTHALDDPDPTDASIRERAAQLLQEHKPLPPETIDVVWQRVEQEKDPDTVFQLLVLLRDNGEIPTEACDWGGSKGITRSSSGTLQLQKNEGLNCIIPKRPGPRL